MYRIIGFDPGYTKLGVGIIEVDDDFEISVVTGVVLYPSWKGASKSLDKIEAMIDAVQKLKIREPEFFEGDLVIVEGQEHYGGRFRGANPNVLIRMGKVSGSLYSLSDCPEKHFVLPKTWTKSRCKEDNHCVILDKLTNQDPDDWPWYPKKPKKSDYEHVIDAVGMAVWGFETYIKGDK